LLWFTKIFHVVELTKFINNLLDVFVVRSSNDKNI
jgi:hypothetical protein